MCELAKTALCVVAVLVGLAVVLYVGAALALGITEIKHELKSEEEFNRHLK